MPPKTEPALTDVPRWIKHLALLIGAGVFFWLIGGFLYQRSIEVSIARQAAAGILEAQVPSLSFRAFMVVWGVFLLVVVAAIAIWLRRRNASGAVT